LRQRLRALIDAGRTVAVPGATDALSAKLVEKHGFEAVLTFPEL
jgi:2-methylisocitrate lyase-like PEP mutase family enzyme